MSLAITRAYDAAADVDRDARTVTATINTDAVDRYKTVICPEGGDFTAYRKNPIVLYEHGRTEAVPVIGRNLWIKAQRRKLIAKTQFLPEGTSPLADTVFSLYAEGFLNGWSIQFRPIADGRPTPDEVRARPELADCERLYRSWELLEYSAVCVPGNPEATRAALARGLRLPGWPEPESGHPPCPRSSAAPRRKSVPP